MAITYKVLGQLNPASGSLSVLYTVPAATSTVCSTLVVASFGASSNIRVAVQPASASIENKHYIVYEQRLEGRMEWSYRTMG